MPDGIRRRSDRQLIGRLWHPRDLGRYAKEAVVVVIHPIQIKPYGRLSKGRERRQDRKLRAAERQATFYLSGRGF